MGIELWRVGKIRDIGMMRIEMINEILQWRNKFLDPKYELTTIEKMIGWTAFFSFGIILAFPILWR